MYKLRNNVTNIIKIVKQISKLEFEKDVINELMGMFNVKQKEIDIEKDIGKERNMIRKE